MAILNKIKNIFGRKAIGAGWNQVGTVLPQGDSFLHFLAQATEEDNPKFITIRNPYLDNAWVYSAIKVMADNFSQVPFVIKHGDEVIETSSMKYGHIKHLFEYVSPYLNKYSLFETIPVWLSLRGECFWQIVRDDYLNKPAEINIIRPENMVEIVKNGELLGWEEWTGETRKIHDIKDIIQFKYYNPYNKYRGLSPLTACLLGLHIDYAAAAYNFYFFNKDATPAGVISSDQVLRPEEADAIEKRWDKKHRGLRKKGSVAVLGQGSKYQPIALAQKDIQYLEQRKWSREEVFAVLGVPPALMSVLEYATIKSNIKEQKKQLFQNNLIPKMHFVEDVLRTDFFEREGYKELTGTFDISQIDALKEDYKDVIDQALKLQQLGYTANEINERLGLGFEEAPWRDQWWISFNMVPAGTSEPEPPKKEVKQIKAPLPDVKRIWRSLVRQTEPIEVEYAKALQEYFYKMRQDILSKIFNHKSVKAGGTPAEDFLFDPEFDELLEKISRPHFERAYKVGLDSIANQIETHFNMTNVRATVSLSKRIKAIKDINTTIKDQLLGNLNPILKEGLEQGQAYDTIAGKLADAARGVLNNARSRAKTIARTEINGAMNQARHDTMIESGIKKHMWTTSLDNDVRYSHLQCEAKVRVIGEPFPNGLEYPHDPAGSPEEVINCRCITVPYIEE